jgi:tRNA pseudouridine55 synthase
MRQRSYSSTRESLLVIDKTPGPSSFDVVRQVRRLLGGEKTGHTGSLDPFASGVLVLLTGKATKLSDTLLTADKSYHARIKLGEATDTMDRTGEIVGSAAVPELTLSGIAEVLKGFEGEWMQVPPMFSAKKVHGVRLYELARQKIHVRRPPIPVQLYRVQALSYEAPFLEIEVQCSKGTYIRSLAEEVGRRLGTVAHLAELRRLSCGAFTLGDSVTVEKLGENVELGMERGEQNYRRFLQSEGLFRRGAPAGLVRSPLPSGARDPLPHGVGSPAPRPGGLRT